MRRPAVLFALLCMLARPAAADDEPWYRGPHGKNRVVHLSLTVSLGVAFLASETVLKPTLAPDVCRWCEPPGLDASVRDALVWDDYDAARSFSNLTGYLAVPIFGVAATTFGALEADPSWARVIDDVVPVLETVAISQIITQAVKFSVGRQRPLAHYRDVPPDHDLNLSFYSGHSALTFGITVSAGMVAHGRGSRLAPWIWGVGLPLSAATAYLRIAADKHYFTDVVTGSIVGAVAGLTIPRFMRRTADATSVSIVPTGRGLAITGAF